MGILVLAIKIIRILTHLYTFHLKWFPKVCLSYIMKESENYTEEKEERTNEQD